MLRKFREVSAHNAVQKEVVRVQDLFLPQLGIACTRESDALWNMTRRESGNSVSATPDLPVLTHVSTLVLPLLVILATIGLQLGHAWLNHSKQAFACGRDRPYFGRFAFLSFPTFSFLVFSDGHPGFLVFANELFTSPLTNFPALSRGFLRLYWRPFRPSLVFWPIDDAFTRGF